MRVVHAPVGRRAVLRAWTPAGLLGVGQLAWAVLVVAALTLTVGLGRAAATGAVAVAVLAAALLTWAAGRRRSRPGPADRVTATRLGLVIGVTALVADSFLGSQRPLSTALLAGVALVLDAVDGRVARRTGTASELGARFDMEVDAFLILVLSIDVAPDVGPWVLALGLWRYAYVAASWGLPWMWAELPPRPWRKVVAALVGITLAVAASRLAGVWIDRLLLAVALALLTESFGRDLWWLWRRRHEAADTTVGTRPRAWVGVAAAGLCWLLLAVPDRLDRITPAALGRIPVEALVLVAVALVLPRALQLPLAVAVGLALVTVTAMRGLDTGFLAALDRPFNPVTDWGYGGGAVDLLGDAIGHRAASGAALGLGVLAATLVVVVPLAVLRTIRQARRHRRRSARLLAGLAAVWAACAALGVQAAASPVASTTTARYAFDRISALPAQLHDEQEFRRALSADPLRAQPPVRPLWRLRGKDVLLVFVESYGRVAVEDPAISPGVDRVLDLGTRRLHRAGFRARTAYLTSPTFGGLSWLAHSTLQSGLWVDDQRRYEALLESDRTTLSGLFGDQGWRTVGFIPSNDRDWPQHSFYGYDAFYDARDTGYVGPRFSYALMPDQFSLGFLQRRELDGRPRRPVMAEIDLVSSHTPWTPRPRMVPWSDVGDGSVFAGQAALDPPPREVWPDPVKVRAAYGDSVEYTWQALISYLDTYGTDDTVVIVLGDHQPASIVSGEHASHDVPISVIARDPDVLRAIQGWGWRPGLRPAPEAPVWPMDAFRNRFVAAYSD